MKRKQFSSVQLLKNLTTLQKTQIHRSRHEQENEVELVNLRVLSTRLINYEVNFTKHQLCTHSLCVVGLRNSAVTFQIEVAHLSPVCSASSKDEHSVSEEKNVDEPLEQLRWTHDEALQGCNVSNIWFS